MAEFQDKAKALAATAAQIARLQRAEPEAKVLEESSASLLHTGSQDNWGETLHLFTLMLQVPVTTYAALDDPKVLEKAVHRRVAQLVRADAGNAITEVIISPALSEEPGPAEPAPENGEVVEEAPSFWQPGFFRLFITHTSQSKDSAHRLKQALAEYQVVAFVAHEDIEPTREWQAEIERALRTMDALSAIITPDFLESRWCDQEVGIAFGRGKLVVPLRRGADPHGFLGKYQGFQTEGLAATAVAQKLADILVAHPLSAQRMADALVERMATSWAWEFSRRTMTLLEKVPLLNNSQVTRLVQSIDANRQVGDAFGVPDRIRELVSRIGRGAAA